MSWAKAVPKKHPDARTSEAAAPPPRSDKGGLPNRRSRTDPGCTRGPSTNYVEETVGGDVGDADLSRWSRIVTACRIRAVRRRELAARVLCTELRGGAGADALLPVGKEGLRTRGDVVMFTVLEGKLPNFYVFCFRWEYELFVASECVKAIIMSNERCSNFFFDISTLSDVNGICDKNVLKFINIFNWTCYFLIRLSFGTYSLTFLKYSSSYTIRTRVIRIIFWNSISCLIHPFQIDRHFQFVRFS